MDKYINTDEVGEDFYSAILDILCEDENNDRANEIIDEFNILPAADVAPVKHGEWIRATKPYPYYDYKCSVCGCEEYRQIDSKGKVRIMNFCPNCGADMSNT